MRNVIAVLAMSMTLLGASKCGSSRDPGVPDGGTGASGVSGSSGQGGAPGGEGGGGQGGGGTSGGGTSGGGGQGGGGTSGGQGGSDPEGVACGPNTCAKGEVCCNESCGICTAPDGACTKQLCEPEYGPFCGGFAGIACPGAGMCVDDPRDDCDPKNGGADCGGVCVCKPTGQLCGVREWNNSPEVCACGTPGEGEACGDTTCPKGEICCNVGCGICAPRGSACTDRACL